ncbi:MAG TPA: helix-turn-helix domain-containing protein [Acidimicrobiia bacterium]|nr:helix-turn-helix domain-containing protein [Acidimicrobiia bacterium]
MTTPTTENQRATTLPNQRRVEPGTRLLSPAELAEYLGVPLATVYRWRSQHDGPAGIRVGRHVRYRLDDVERWLDAHRDDRGPDSR